MSTGISAINNALIKQTVLPAGGNLRASLSRLWGPFTSHLVDEVYDHGQCSIIAETRAGNPQLFLSNFRGHRFGAVPDLLGIAKAMAQRGLSEIKITKDPEGLLSPLLFEKVLCGVLDTESRSESLIDIGGSNCYFDFRYDWAISHGSYRQGLLLFPEVEYLERTPKTSKANSQRVAASSPPRPLRENIRINKLLTEARDVKEIISVISEYKNLFDPVNTATALHRLAKLSRSSRRSENLTLTVADLALMVIAKIDAFKAQELSNAAWAIATLGIVHNPLFELVAQEAMGRFSEFNAQNLTNTAWAFATLGIVHEPLFKALAQEVMGRISEFKAQELSNAAWAFATLGVVHEPLFKALAQEAMGRFSEFKAQNLSNTAWAFATLGIVHEPLMKALAQEAMGRIGEFDAQGLSNTTWAFATLGIVHKPLFEVVAQEVMGRISEFKAQNLTNTAWAFATLGIVHEPLFKALAQEAMGRIGEFNAQGLSNTTWAFAVCDYFPTEFLSVFQHAISSKRRGFYTDDALTQLWHVHLISDAFELPVMLRGEIERLLKELSFHKPNPSGFQAEVFGSLRKIDAGWQEEFFEHGYFIDCVLPQLRIAIECDGDSYHYASNGQLLGADLLKDRILKKLGWRVIRIRQSEWEIQKDKQKYLKARLAA